MGFYLSDMLEELRGSLVEETAEFNQIVPIVREFMYRSHFSIDTSVYKSDSEEVGEELSSIVLDRFDLRVYRKDTADGEYIELRVCYFDGIPIFGEVDDVYDRYKITDNYSLEDIEDVEWRFADEMMLYVIDEMSKALDKVR